MKQLQNSLLSLTTHVSICRCLPEQQVGIQWTAMCFATRRRLWTLMDILPIELTPPSFYHLSLVLLHNLLIHFKLNNIYITRFFARLNVNSSLKEKIVFPSVKPGTGEDVGRGKQLDGWPSGNIPCYIFWRVRQVYLRLPYRRLSMGCVDCNLTRWIFSEDFGFPFSPKYARINSSWGKKGFLNSVTLYWLKPPDLTNFAHI